MKRVKLTKKHLFNTIKEVLKEEGVANTTNGTATMTPGKGEQYATPKAFKKKKVKESNTSAPFKEKFKQGTHPQAKAIDYKKIWENKIHIGTDTKTDSDIYFEPETGLFYINVVDAAGNRWNKIQANTIDDILSRYPHWKWTKQGQAHFPEAIDEENVAGVVPSKALDQDAWDKTVGYKSDLVADIYTEAQLEKLYDDDKVRVTLLNNLNGQTGTVVGIHGGFVRVKMDRDQKVYSFHSSDLEKVDSESEEQGDDEDRYDWYTDSYEDNNELSENYSKFKNETRTRSKPEQFHQAVKGIKKKLDEINRIFEYCTQLQNELLEGEDSFQMNERTKHTMEKLHRNILEIFKKSKQLRKL